MLKDKIEKVLENVYSCDVRSDELDKERIISAALTEILDICNAEWARKLDKEKIAGVLFNEDKTCDIWEVAKANINIYKHFIRQAQAIINHLTKGER